MTILTQSLLQSLLDYDPETGVLTWKHRPDATKTWNTRYAGTRAFGCVNKHGYHVGAINDKLQRACRVIWIYVHGYEPTQVDHINGIRTDDRLENLRNVSGKDNQKNMKRATNNKSGVTGVSWNAEKNKWDAAITCDGVRYALGRFTDIKDAIAIRKQAESDYGFHPNHGR